MSPGSDIEPVSPIDKTVYYDIEVRDVNKSVLRAFYVGDLAMARLSMYMPHFDGERVDVKKETCVVLSAQQLGNLRMHISDDGGIFMDVFSLIHAGLDRRLTLSLGIFKIIFLF